MRTVSAMSLSVAVAALLAAGCGSSTKTSTSTKDAGSVTTTTKPKPKVPGTGKTLVSEAKLKSALLTAREAGAGWTLVVSDTSSGSAQPGPSTSKPANQNGSPSLANVKTTPACKAVLKNFDLTTKVNKTVAKAVFAKADRTSLAQTVVSSTSTRSQPATDRAGISKCKNITVSTGLGQQTLGLAALPLSKFGDDSLGIRLTVTAMGQGKKVTQNAYLVEIQRGNTVDVVVMADGVSPDGSVTPVQADRLAALARTADAKVAKVT